MGAFPINGEAAMNEPPQHLWDDSYVEKRWGKKPGFLSDMRARGQGPRFMRLSARTVRYWPRDVEEYEQQQFFSSTAASLDSDFKAPARARKTAGSPIQPAFPRKSR